MLRSIKQGILVILIPLLPFCSLAQRLDSIKVFATLDSAEYLFSNEKNIKAISYCHKAAQLASQSHYAKGIAYAQLKMADIYINIDSLAKAQVAMKKSLSIGQKLHDSLIIAIATMQSAQIKMYDNHYDDAVILFKQCIAYFKNHPSKYAALAYNDLGYTYGRTTQFTLQAKNLIEALNIYDKIAHPDREEIAVVLSNLSSLYISLGNKTKAIEYGEKAITIRRQLGNIAKLSLSYSNLSQVYLGIDSNKALQYQQLGVKYAEQSKSQALMLSAYISSSLFASVQKEYTKALAYENKVVRILEKTGKDPAMLSRRYIAVGFYHQILNDSLDAIHSYYKALALAQKINNKVNIRDAYLYLTVFYKNHKNFEQAYNHYKKYIAYRDSLVNEQTVSGIAEIEAKYQTVKKDKEIIQLNADKKIKELKIEKQLALLLGNKLEAEKKEKEIVLLSQAKELQILKIKHQTEQIEKQHLLAENNKQHWQLAEKEKLLQQKQLKNSKLVKNILLASVLLLLLLGYFLFNRYQLKRKIREQEAVLNLRNNIAKELHDEVGSTLTSIKILSEISNKEIGKNQEKATQLLQKISEQSANAQQSISDIVWSVKSENERIENLIIRMREYIAHTLEQKHIHTTLKIEGNVFDQTLEMHQRKDFLLLFKEAVNNIVKYANADKVNIYIAKQDKNIYFTIADNGIGFNPELQTSSSGIKNIKARAVALGGNITIQSKINEGTTIRLYFPTT